MPTPRKKPLTTPRITNPHISTLDERTASGRENLLTRRSFLYGAAGLGAVGVLAAGGAVVSSLVGDNGESSSVRSLNVSADAVSTLSAETENYSQTPEDAPLVQLTGSFDLPFGTLLWSNNETTAACLVPMETAKPLTTVGVLQLSSGSFTTVLEGARDGAAGFEIYDVRCSESGLIWTEANILQGVWRIWAAPLSQATLGEPIQLDQGDSAWETPSLAAVGSHAFWQCVPKRDGVSETANSCIKRAAFGSREVEVLYESKLRMETPLFAGSRVIVCTPHAPEARTSCKLTCINAETGEVADDLILPTSMIPMEAGYGPHGFSFCFDAGYSYGGGIANLGTYCPNEASERTRSIAQGNAGSADGTSEYQNIPWFCFARTPTTAPAWCGNFFVVKSTSSVAVIDLAARSYTSLLAEDTADDWGEQLASSGSGSSIVTYQHIDDGRENGTRTCRVRVWSV